MGGVGGRAIDQVDVSMQTEAIVRRDSLAAIKRVNHFIKRYSKESKLIFAHRHLGTSGRIFLGARQLLSDGFGATSKVLECFFRSSLKDEVNRVRVHLLKNAEYLPLLRYHG